MRKMYVFTDVTNCIRQGFDTLEKAKAYIREGYFAYADCMIGAGQSLAEIKSAIAIAEEAIAEVENGESDYVSFFDETIGCELFTIDVD